MMATEVLLLLILVVLGVQVLYYFVFAIAGHKKIKTCLYKRDVFRKIAVLIPAYKEDKVIIDTVKNLSRMHYPGHLFKIFVIADHLQKETILALNSCNIHLIKLQTVKSTKVKAMQAAMKEVDNSYDIITVFDADNHADKDFLLKVNRSLLKPYGVVQGHRTGKNRTNNISMLDAVSEEINNHIFRKGHRNLGLSSAIIGSGMAFEAGLFRDLVMRSKAIGGFDKEFELKMAKNTIKVNYLPTALIYDEKVSDTKNFYNQRRRWLSAQFFYAGKYFLNAAKHLLFKGNLDYFNKAFQMILLPRMIALGFTGILTASVFGFDLPYKWGYLILLLTLIFSLLISIPKQLYNMNLLRGLVWLPFGFLVITRSLLKIRGGNKRFIHTTHHNVSSSKN